MKLIAVLFLLVSKISYGCVLSAQRLDASEIYGFAFDSMPSDICGNCEMLEIVAPDKYKGHALSHMLFSTFVKNELKSKLVTYISIATGESKFGAIVTRDRDTRYKISILYGAGKCMSYEFTYAIGNNI